MMAHLIWDAGIGTGKRTFAYNVLPDGFSRNNEHANLYLMTVNLITTMDFAHHAIQDIN